MLTDRDAPKEARVFVRLDCNPWITTRCPTCREHVVSHHNFCPNCGQKLEFNRFKAVLATGGVGIKASREWTECVENIAPSKEALLEQLKKMEKSYGVEEDSILKIMRETYVNTYIEKLSLT